MKNISLNKLFDNTRWHSTEAEFISPISLPAAGSYLRPMQRDEVKNQMT